MSTIIADGARVIHALPGRIRVRLSGWSGRGHRRIEEGLRRVGGVKHARANPLTCTVLIRFDPGAITESTILAVLGALKPRALEPRAAGQRLPRPGAGATLRTALVAIRRLADLRAVLSGPSGWAAVGAAVQPLQALPWVRNGLDRMLGTGLAHVVLLVSSAVVSAFAGSPLGAAVAALEVILGLVNLLTLPLRMESLPSVAGVPAAA